MAQPAPSQRWLTRRRLLVLLACGAGLALLGYVTVLLRDLGEKRIQPKRSVQRITIVQPPPPPPPVKPPELKPPEPKLEEPKSQPRVPEPDPGPEKSDAPEQDRLGVDAEPGIGSDSFGLEARKGGRPLLGGGGGNALLWYGGQLQQALEAQLHALLAGSSGRTNRYSVVLDVWVDAGGRIGRTQLTGTSGKADVDLAIRKALPRLQIALRTAPPPGMPQPIRLRVSTEF